MKLARTTSAALCLATGVFSGCGASIAEQIAPEHVAVRVDECRADGTGAAMLSALGDHPLRFGIGSIVHEQDGTTESFLAYDMWKDQPLVPGRPTEVALIDHPIEADYSVTGVVTGGVAYRRKKRVPGWKRGIMAGTYTTGIPLSGLGVVLGLANNESAGTVTLVGLAFLAPAIGIHLSVLGKPANKYSWNQTGHFVLRRRGVRVGEFTVEDHQKLVTWSLVKHLRATSLKGLLTEAHARIAACIRADVGEAGGGA